MAKAKQTTPEERLTEVLKEGLTFNPLLNALRENDKKNLFKTSVSTAFFKTGFPLFDYYFGSVINIHDDAGNILRQEPRIGQAGGTANMIIGNTGSGKAQPDSTMIPTPNGYRRLDSLNIGDEVFNFLGHTTKVIGVYPQDEKDVWEVTFSDGRVSKCCDEHLWTYITSKGNFKTKPLKDIFKDYKGNTSEGNDKNKYFIPQSKAVLFNPQPVSMDPYTLGLFIGNGCMREKYLTISSPDDVIPNAIARNHGYIVKKYSENNYSYNFIDGSGNLVRTKDFFKNIPTLIDKYSYEKCIPSEYIFNSEEVRWGILSGLMDTDGSIQRQWNKGSEDPPTISYTSTSEELLLSVRTIINSFGFQARIYSDSRTDKYTSGYCGTLVMTIPEYLQYKLFKYDNKQKMAIRSSFLPLRRKRMGTLAIDQIKKLDVKESMRCIMIDDPYHLYLTEDFIVTHNTTLAVQLGSNIIRPYKNAAVIHYDCEHRMDITRAEIISQLPSSDFEEGGRYILKSGNVGLDTMQETIVRLYAAKMKMKDELSIDTGILDEFGKPVRILEPTVIIIDSITSVISETFSPDNAKEVASAESLRSNTEGARDAKSLKGFFKDILPLCKDANIIIYMINHININMSMNAFVPVAKQQNFLKQDESIPGGKTLLYYPFNIIKLIAKPGDDYAESSDGFAGHTVVVEPIKSSSNQSGNTSKGVFFEMIFSFKHGFDSLRSLVHYGKNKGIVDGNKPRMKFKGDESCTFSWKGLIKDKDEKPIWDNIKKFIIPELKSHLPFVEPNEVKFDQRSLDY